MAVRHSKLGKLRSWWEWHQPEPQPLTWLDKATRRLQRRLPDLTIVLVASAVAPLQPETDKMALRATETSVVDERVQPDVVAPYLPIGAIETEPPSQHGELSQPEAQPPAPAALHAAAPHAAASVRGQAPEQLPAQRAQHDLPRRAGLAALDTEASRDSLDRETIRRVIRRNSERIRGCYERRLLYKASANGRIEVRFKIMMNGTVESATATGDDPKLGRCSESIIRNIVFPRSRSSVEVTYPFYFFPAQDLSSERPTL